MFCSAGENKNTHWDCSGRSKCSPGGWIFPIPRFAGKGQQQLKGGTEGTSAAGIAPTSVLQGWEHHCTGEEQSACSDSRKHLLINNHILNGKAESKEVRYQSGQSKTKTNKRCESSFKSMNLNPKITQKSLSKPCNQNGTRRNCCNANPWGECSVLREAASGCALQTPPGPRNTCKERVHVPAQ